MSYVPAGVMELVDVADSKSAASDGMGVRVPPPAPRRSKLHITCSDFFKSQSALIALLLLSKSNPLRWASIWFWAQSRKKIGFNPLLQVKSLAPQWVQGFWLFQQLKLHTRTAPEDCSSGAAFIANMGEKRSHSCSQLCQTFCTSSLSSMRSIILVMFLMSSSSVSLI